MNKYLRIKICTVNKLEILLNNKKVMVEHIIFIVGFQMMSYYAKFLRVE